ncbi:MAG: NADH-quinone oxidoreductase subunit C, partial [Aggregatilineales bacterium]
MTDQVLPQVTDLPSTIAALKERFPNAVKDDTRNGYEGVIVDAASLPDFARVIRDEYGFNYLSSLTAVDYLGHGDHLEVVYHAFRVPSGGKPLVFKAQTDRQDAVIPSLVSIYPGADFQEREAYDLYGIHFAG